MILSRIIEAKHAEVAERRSYATEADLRARPGWKEPRRGFRSALERSDGRRIIAEIKKASPSRGVIRDDFDPALHARQYQQAGATCVSVLTDEPFFQGSLAYLSAVREATSLPLLQKDFMVDPWQVAEARAYGADAILLIVSAIGASRLVEIDLAAREEGLDVLVEVHSESEMAVALELGATLVGINNRDLETFETSTDITRRLATMVPEGVVLVSESGLSDPSELRELEELGVAGFLIGESLMGSEHPGDALAEFMAG